jgi:proteic killer suppression protein
MIEISTTATFDRLFSKLPKPIQRKAAAKTDLFKENPFHPSLHTEKLHPKHHEV